MKFNTDIVKHDGKYTKTKLHTPDTSAVSFYDSYKINEVNKVITENTAIIDEAMRKNDIASSVAGNKLGKDRTKRSNRVYENTKSEVFEHILAEMFIESLVLDKDFVVEHSMQLHDYCKSELNKRGGYSLLVNRARETKSSILESLVALCEKVAKKEGLKALKEENKDKKEDERLFGLDEEEKEDLDYEKDQLNIDGLASLVKDKVLTVVKDEKEKAKKKEEFIQDLTNELEEGEGEAEVEESITSILVGNKEKTPTLFESFMGLHYKECLESLNDSSSTVEEPAMDEEDKDGMEEDELLDDEFDDFSMDDLKDEPDDMNAVNMDKVLAESITKYTLLELLHTIKLDILDNNRTKELITENQR